MTVSEVDTLTDGEMVTLLTVGARLLRLTDAADTSEPPLPSVTVAEQVMLSPTLAVEELKIKVWLVPS